MAILTFQMPERVTLEKGDGYSGTFVFKPLERGYGITVGNALRRVLLSSLEGYAVTSVKFPDVMHEFSTIKGVVEDVTEIILNLKMLRFKKTSELADERIKIKIENQSVLLGKDIQRFTSSFEVLNPDHLVCKLDESAVFEMEITITKGRGYVAAEENAQMDTEEYGLISLDATFTPVKNVEYFVEDTRVEQRTDYERLSIRVDTDGSIAPKDALQEAARVLMQHLSLFMDKSMGTGFEKEREDEVVDESTLRMRKLLKTTLEDLDLSMRAYNCLKAANVRTLSDIVQLEVADMMKFRNFGKKSLAELEQLVSEKGISFGMDVSSYKLED